MQEITRFAKISLLVFLHLGSAIAINGPEMAATATQFPQIVAISAPSGNFYTGAIISSKYVIAPAHIVGQNREGVRVFSGDLTVIADAMGHRVASISDAAVGAILKLCTAVPNHVSVSLAAADNFNFTSDTTGKLVYVNMRVAQKGLFVRDAAVLTDANCMNDASQFSAIEYFEPLGTCVKFDTAASSCVHMVGSSSTTLTSYPMLVIGTKSVAMYEAGVCNSVTAPNTAMNSTHLFAKLGQAADKMALVDAVFDFK